MYSYLYVLCAEPCARNCSSSAERERLSMHTHVQRECSAECAASCVTKDLHTSLPRSRLRFFTAMQIQYASTPLYSSRLYPQNPVFEIVHQESVKVYFTHEHTFVQQQAQSAEPCVRNCSSGERESLFYTRVCVVCVFSSHSFWTSSSLDVPAGVTQEEGHTGFLIHLLSAVRALIFLARRIQPFLSLVDREVEFCVLTI